MPKRLRFYYWLLRGLLKRHRVAFATSIILLVSIIFFWNNILNFFLLSPLQRLFSKVDRQYYVEGVVGVPRIINPLFSSTDLEKDINEMVFQGLFNVNASGELEPELAERFSIESNKEYTVYLRRSIKWHDGADFSANDVIYTTKLAQNPDYKSVYLDALKDVEISKVDDYTIKFRLKEPFSPFLTTLDFGIIPEHIPLSHYKPIGTGVFKIKQVNKKQLVLTKGWFDLTLRFYQDYSSALTALKLGEIQGLGGVTPKDALELEKWRTFKLYSKPMYRRFVAIYFNLKSGNASDKNIRQALRLSVAKDRIIQEVTNGHAAKAIGPIQPASWASRDMKDTGYNQGGAAGVLEKAGWKKEDGVWTKDNQPLTLSLSYPDLAVFKETAQIIIKTWSELGIKMEDRSYDPLHFKEQVITPKNFEVVLSSQEIGADPDQYVLWHSTQVNNSNISGISSVKIDKVLEDARKSINQDERKDKYADFQKYLNDEIPAVFLFFPPYNYVVASRVVGISLDNFTIPSNRYNSSLNWRIEKRFF